MDAGSDQAARGEGIEDEMGSDHVTMDELQVAESGT